MSDEPCNHVITIVQGKDYRYCEVEGFHIHPPLPEQDDANADDDA